MGFQWFSGLAPPMRRQPVGSRNFLSPPAGSASLKPEMHRGILQHIRRRHNELSLKETWLELGMENSQGVHIV